MDGDVYFSPGLACCYFNYADGDQVQDESGENGCSRTLNTRDGVMEDCVVRRESKVMYDLIECYVDRMIGCEDSHYA